MFFMMSSYATVIWRYCFRKYLVGFIALWKGVSIGYYVAQEQMIYRISRNPFFSRVKAVVDSRLIPRGVLIFAIYDIGSFWFNGIYLVFRM